MFISVSQELCAVNQHTARAAIDQTENCRELRIPSAGPDDLISYKYTVRLPTTKMELILGFLSKQFIQHLRTYARLEAKQVNFWL